MTDKCRKTIFDLAVMLREKGNPSQSMPLRVQLIYNFLLGFVCVVVTALPFLLLPEDSEIIALIVGTLAVMIVSGRYDGTSYLSSAKYIVSLFTRETEKNNEKSDEFQLRQVVAFWVIAIYPLLVALLSWFAGCLWLLPVYVLAPVAANIYGMPKDAYGNGMVFKPLYWWGMVTLIAVTILDYLCYGVTGMLIGFLTLATVWGGPMLLRALSKDNPADKNIALFVLRTMLMLVIVLASAL